jgi:hypothetical protein
MSDNIQQFLHKRQLIAAALRKAYILHKTERLGKKFKLGRRDDLQSIWDKVAENCMQAGADPEDFIKAAFTYASQKDGPFVTALYGKHAENWYKNYMETLAFEKPKVPQFSDQPYEEVPDEETDDAGNIIEEVKNADEATFRADLILTLAKIKRIVGREPDRSNLTDEDLDVLRDPFVPIPFYMRVLMGYPCPVIMKKWGAKGADFLISRTNFKYAAEAYNYPTEDIIQWRMNT